MHKPIMKTMLYATLLGVLLLTLSAAFAQEIDLNGGVNMRLVLPQTPVAVGEEFEVLVQVNASRQPLDGAAAYLSFDPSVVQVVQILPSSTLPILLQGAFDNGSGTIDFAAGQLGATASGSFTLATIRMRALTPTAGMPITFSYDRARQTDISFSGSSILGVAEDSLLVISAVPALNLDSVAELPRPGVGERHPLALMALPIVLDVDASAGTWFTATNWVVEDQAAAGRDGLAWRAASNLGAQAILELNAVADLRMVNSAQLSFSSLFTGSGAAAVQIGIDGVNWYTLAQVQPSQTWTTVTADLTPFIGQTLRVRFVWQPSVNAQAVGDWRIDDVTILPVTVNTLPTLPPSDPTVPQVPDLPPVAPEEPTVAPELPEETVEAPSLDLDVTPPARPPEVPAGA